MNAQYKPTEPYLTIEDMSTAMTKTLSNMLEADVFVTVDHKNAWIESNDIGAMETIKKIISDAVDMFPGGYVNIEDSAGNIVGIKHELNILQKGLLIHEKI